jgi:protein O-GlcNAc transferase
MNDEQVQFELARAVEAHLAGDLDRAEHGYRRVLRSRSGHFDALHMLGMIQYSKGHLDLASRTIGEALAVTPGAPRALSNRSIVRLALADAGGALEDADRALEASPKFSAAHNNRANALVALERFDEALAAYEMALAYDPKLAAAWSGRSVILNRSRHLAEAEASARRAIDLSPDLADAWCNLGIARYERGDHGGGLAAYEQALALNPSHADALYNRGIRRHDNGDFEGALADLEAARRLKRFDGDDAQILHTRMNMCDWRDLDASRARLSESIFAGAPAIAPFQTLGLFDDPVLHLRAARAYVSRRFPEKALVPRATRSPGAPTRIAYLSADFRSHPVSYLLIDTLERHDRARFEIIAVSIGPREDAPFGARVRAAFDSFVEAGEMPDEVLATFIADARVDILVDLMGHTRLGRPGVLARRPAPLQVNFLGYPGSVGAPYMDYIIADATVATRAKWFAEKLCLLPDVYLPTSSPPSPMVPARRAEHGLPENAFVFCCFCNNWKITPEVFAIWMRLLAANPDSVLWLLANNSNVIENLRTEAMDAGVNPQRLIFAPRINHAEHLARHVLADLALDTYPYGAHTTASDALWMGLPLVTRSGLAFQTRVARSVLLAAGLDRFAVETAEEYETLAQQLASQPAFMADARRDIAAARTSPLFDSNRFVRNLEAAYDAMLNRAASGLRPARIKVRPR